ncbi:MAG: AraC family transcriptional regulator [Pedobacter sp.]|nr:MAG: AraC family transcriptional regulator [Pedobacter sp.]
MTFNNQQKQITLLQITPICFDCPTVIHLSNAVALLYVDKAEGDLVVFTNAQEAARVTILNHHVFLLRNTSVNRLEGSLIIGHLLQFEMEVLNNYLLQNLAQRNTGLFDLKQPLPHIEVTANGVFFLNNLICQLNAELDAAADSNEYTHYLFLLLKHANRNAKPFAPDVENSKMGLKIAALIDAYYMTNRSTSFYANKLGITQRNLNIIVHNMYQCRFFEIVMQRLLYEAEIKLADKEIPLKVIAYELGFSHYNHFNTYYLRYKGISPKEYRKNTQS